MQSKIKFSLFLILSNLTHLTFAQEVLQPEWVIRKASPNADGNAEAWGIDFDSKGNIYWATNQNRPGLFQGLDVVFYKLNADGDEIWPEPTIYAGQYAQQIYKVTATDSIIYLGGRNCTQLTLDPDLPFCDMLIIAVNAATGDTLWTTTWDRGFGYEEADGLIVQNDGIYVSGWSAGDNTDMDMGLLKLSFDGEISWSNAWGTTNRDHQDGHIVMDDSVIYAAGLINGLLNPGLCLIKDYNGQAVLAKFSRKNGGYLNHVAFGRSDPWCNFENALGMASNGQWLYVVGVTTIASDDFQIFLKAFDKDLNMAWETEWGDSALETARAIAVGEDGSIYIGGNTNSAGSGDLDVVVLKFSPAGKLIWSRIWGAEKEDNVLDVAVAGEDIYITGKTESFHPNGKFEAFLLKAKVDINTSVEVNPVVVGDFTLEANYPNPFNSSTNIRFNLPIASQVSFVIYNALGQTVRKLQHRPYEAGSHQIVWDGRDDFGKPIASGVYFLAMVANREQEANDFVQIRKVLSLQ